MARGRRGTTEGPLALVASLAGGGGRRREPAAVLAEQMRGLRDGAAHVLAGPLPKSLAKRIPSRRKRKSFVKRASQRLDGLSKVASSAATALTVAAAAAELASSLRGQGTDEDRRSGERAAKSGGTASRGRTAAASKPRQSKPEEMRRAS